jgi:hypothetical protein
VTLRARWVTLRARWVTLRARWVTLRARWVTLRARWVTLRARWVTLRARWVQASTDVELLVIDTVSFERYLGDLVRYINQLDKISLDEKVRGHPSTRGVPSPGAHSTQ